MNKVWRLADGFVIVHAEVNPLSQRLNQDEIWKYIESIKIRSKLYLENNKKVIFIKTNCWNYEIPYLSWFKDEIIMVPKKRILELHEQCRIATNHLLWAEFLEFAWWFEWACFINSVSNIVYSWKSARQFLKKVSIGWVDYYFYPRVWEWKFEWYANKWLLF